MARTKKKGSLKTKFIKIYVTPEQYDELKMSSKQKGLTLANYVRQHYIK